MQLNEEIDAALETIDKLAQAKMLPQSKLKSFSNGKKALKATKQICKNMENSLESKMRGAYEKSINISKR